MRTALRSPGGAGPHVALASGGHCQGLPVGAVLVDLTETEGGLPKTRPDFLQTQWIVWLIRTIQVLFEQWVLHVQANSCFKGTKACKGKNDGLAGLLFRQDMDFPLQPAIHVMIQFPSQRCMVEFAHRFHVPTVGNESVKRCLNLNGNGILIR